MELVRGVMLNMIIMVFVTTLLDLLLPNGSMRRYVKMVMGFFVVLTLLQPVIQLVSPDNFLNNWQLTLPEMSDNAITAQGELETAQKQVDRLYQQKVEEQITALLLLSSEWKQFTVHCVVENACLQQVVITVIDEEVLDRERMMQALCSYYGLEAEQILVKLEEEMVYGVE